MYLIVRGYCDDVVCAYVCCSPVVGDTLDGCLFDVVFVNGQRSVAIRVEDRKATEAEFLFSCLGWFLDQNCIVIASLESEVTPGLP